MAPRDKPAILPDAQVASIDRVSVVGRTLKMLRPICATCQRGRYAWDWWQRCQHSPYVSVGERKITSPVYEDLPDGRKKLTGTETIVEFFERPNWVQVVDSPRINNMPRRKRFTYGFIYPEELRTAEFPNGIVNPCEYRDCFQQEGVKQYVYGRFCRKREAQLVGHDREMEGGGGALEVGDDPRSVKKRERQLNAVLVTAE